MDVHFTERMCDMQMESDIISLTCVRSRICWDSYRGNGFGSWEAMAQLSGHGFLNSSMDIKWVGEWMKDNFTKMRWMKVHTWVHTNVPTVSWLCLALDIYSRLSAQV